MITKKTRTKLSAKAKLRGNNGNSFKGRSHSEEAKAKISASLKGKPHKQNCSCATHKPRYRFYRASVLYGVSIEVLKALREAQNNLCGICNQEKPLNVDHDHETNHVRGYLCSSCNGNLGWFEKHRNNIEKYL